MEDIYVWVKVSEKLDWHSISCNLFMMKRFVYLLFFTLFFGGRVAYSGFDYKQLEGEWNVVKIIDVKTDIEVKGIHAPQNGYLKFTFIRKKLFISRAPFDRGTKNEFYVKDGVIKKNHFESHKKIETWESAYKIEKLTKNEMVLETVTRPGRNIKYYLKKIEDIHSKDEKIVFNPIFFVTFFNEEGVVESELKSYSFERESFHFKTPIKKEEGSFLDGLRRMVDMPIVENKNKIMGFDVVLEVVLDSSGRILKLKKLNEDNTRFTDSIVKYMSGLKWDVGYVPNGDVHLEFHFKYLRLPSGDIDLINKLDQ